MPKRCATPNHNRHELADYRLGDALVRVRSRTIETDGESRQLDHKALQVLHCLVQQADAARTEDTARTEDAGRMDVVRKEDLFDRVWPQTHVSDDVLTGAISRLRRALGDDPRTPRFIETVPSVGYRLIATIEPVEPPEAKPRTSKPVATRLHWSWRLTAALVVVLTLIVLSVVRQPAKETSRSIAVLPLANLTGDPAQAHLAAGMSEALITGLARQEGFCRC